MCLEQGWRTREPGLWLSTPGVELTILGIECRENDYMTNCSIRAVLTAADIECIWCPLSAGCLNITSAYGDRIHFQTQVVHGISLMSTRGIYVQAHFVSLIKNDKRKIRLHILPQNILKESNSF